MPGSEPITAGLNLGTELLTLVTGVLPSDETQRDMFKEKYPIRYARIRMRMYRKCLRHLQFRWHEDIDTFVWFTMGAFPKDEQDYAIKLLHQTLQR